MTVCFFPPSTTPDRIRAMTWVLLFLLHTHHLTRQTIDPGNDNPRNAHTAVVTTHHDQCTYNIDGRTFAHRCLS